ncbi:MAG: GNAT family N-acetyltransferase [Bdellovibrionales bacterium]|nr:GNAT family N-acetyltransferase [Bdellovibrionales bacterium]
MRVRQATAEDRDALVDLFVILNQESAFLAFEPGECERQRKNLHAMMEGNLRQEQSLVLVAEENGRAVGLLIATGSLMQRRRLSVHLIVGILQAYTGKGLGQDLMASLFEWAEKRGLRRLELTVMAHNARALALYKKCGFEVEGKKRDSLRVGDAFVDEFYMAKLLPLREGTAAPSPGN